MTKTFGYEYETHMALEDALAAGELFRHIRMQNELSPDEVHSYSLVESTTDKLDERLVTNLHSLSGIIQGIIQGIIDGIACDDNIRETEIIKLKGWLADHDYLTGVYPYDKLVKTVNDVIDDGKLDYWEKQTLLEICKEIADPLSAHSRLENTFPLENKTFCLTGEFVLAPRNIIARKLKEKGAIEKSGVSAKLDYLFVGGMGSDAWKFGNFGGKIARALELQGKGAKVLIVAEEELEGVVM